MVDNDHKKDESEYLKELLDIQLPLPKRVFSCLAEKYLVIIKNQARLFEMTEGLKPTVFLTADIWREILRDYNHVVTHKTREEDEVFGYTVKLVRGENQLYLGYRLSTRG
jgi:hypothetical protein